MNKVITYLMMFHLLISLSGQADAGELDPYMDALINKGIEPSSYVLDKLSDHDLIIFDDALHTAVRPFEFYTELISNPDFCSMVGYVFLEVVAVNQQPALDSYLESEPEDLTLLYPAFQNDFSGRGWPYETYFDLIRAVKEANSELPEEQKLRVIAVNAPEYWEKIETPRDLELFRLSLSGNDYTMYRIISSYMKEFRSGIKGILLTNTRHAYKGIKDSAGDYYLNCGTFFHLRHPGRTFSIRLHNITLSLKKKRETGSETARSTEGLEKLVIEWVRMENGLWDRAFREFGDRRVALDLQRTPFGMAPYVGNHMLDVEEGQTIYDAYGGLIFLGPLEEARRTAMVDYIYTGRFRMELGRRIKILYNQEQLKTLLENNGCNSIEEYIEKEFTYQPEIPEPLVKEIEPLNHPEKK